MGKSKILGIISICAGCIIPAIGILLSIIGLTIKKEKGKEDRDKTLNIIGLIVSLIAWGLYSSMYL